MGYSYKTDYWGIIIILFSTLLLSRSINATSNRANLLSYNSDLNISEAELMSPLLYNEKNSFVNTTESFIVIDDFSPYHHDLFKGLHRLSAIQQPRTLYILGHVREGELYIGGKWLGKQDVLEWISGLGLNRSYLEEINFYNDYGYRRRRDNRRQ